MLLDLLGLIGARAWIPKVSDQPRNLHEFNTFSIGPEGIAFQLGGEPLDRVPQEPSWVVNHPTGTSYGRPSSILSAQRQRKKYTLLYNVSSRCAKWSPTRGDQGNG